MNSEKKYFLRSRLEGLKIWYKIPVKMFLLRLYKIHFLKNFTVKSMWNENWCVRPNSY